MTNLDPFLIPLISPHMKRFVLSVFLVFLVSFSVFSQNWTNLFDGTTLTGWKQLAGKATYQVFRGTIMGVSVPNSPNSFLCTEAEYGDFVLEMEVLVDDTLGNSGVQFRSHFDKTANADARRGAVEPRGAEASLEPRRRTNADLPPLLKVIMQEYSATGMPPAYLPKSPQADEGASS